MSVCVPLEIFTTATAKKAEILGRLDTRCLSLIIIIIKEGCKKTIKL